MQDFRHIKAWQRAHALAIALHKRTRTFSRLGYARLRAQLTAAADSIGDTIIEGAGAATAKEFARFLDMSIKSANETEGHLLKARDLDLRPLAPGLVQRRRDSSLGERRPSRFLTARICPLAGS